MSGCSRSRRTRAHPRAGPPPQPSRSPRPRFPRFEVRAAQADLAAEETGTPILDETRRRSLTCPANWAQGADLMEQLTTALDRLPERQAYVIRRYHRRRDPDTIGAGWGFRTGAATAHRWRSLPRDDQRCTSGPSSSPDLPPGASCVGYVVTTGRAPGWARASGWARGGAGGNAGAYKSNTVLLPTTEWTSTQPPCWRKVSMTDARPRPVPPEVWW